VEREDDRHSEATCLKSNFHNVKTAQCLEDLERGSFKCRMFRADMPRLVGYPLVLIMSSECVADSVVRWV